MLAFVYLLNMEKLSIKKEKKDWVMLSNANKD